MALYKPKDHVAQLTARYIVKRADGLDPFGTEVIVLVRHGSDGTGMRRANPGRCSPIRSEV
jgi:hypothetical protein